MRRPKASSESVARTRTASQFSSYLFPLDRATANILIQPRGGDRFNHTPSGLQPGSRPTVALHTAFLTETFHGVRFL